MTRKSDKEFLLVDAIASEAYLHLMVSCMICERDLMAHDLAIPEANDPMQEWAEVFSEAAKESGWVVSKAGGVLCRLCRELT